MEDRILTIGIACILCCGCAGWQPEGVPALSEGYPFAGGYDWALAQPLEFTDRVTGEVITVPRGFVTDCLSVYPLFWGILPPNGAYGRPAILHDYLYWDQQHSRAESDLLFRRAMEDASVEVRKRKMIYRTLRLGGQYGWISATRNRRLGKPRIVPEQFLPPPPEVTWKEYREFLYREGVRAEGRGVGNR